MKSSTMLRLAFAVAMTVCHIPAAFGARMLALGPNGVDGADLSGDAGSTRGGVRSVWAGTHGVAVWVVRRTYQRYGIDGARFDADGRLLGAPVPLVENLEPSLDGWQKTLGLSVSGNELLLVWQNFSAGVFARRLAPDLTWLDAAPVVIKSHPGFDPAYYYWIDVASNAQRHAVLITPYPIYFNTPVSQVMTLARLGHADAPAPEILDVETPNTGTVLDAALTARPDSFLVAWRSRDADQMHQVQVRTMGLTGADAGPVHAMATPENAEGEYPAPHHLAVAPLGDGYAVAWAHFKYQPGSGVVEFPRFWRRVDATGTPLAEGQELFALPPYVDEARPLRLQSVSDGVLAFTGEKPADGTAPHQRIIRRLLSADGTAGPTESFGEVQAVIPESLQLHTTGSGALVVGEVSSPDVYSSPRAAVASPLTAGNLWGSSSHLLSSGIPAQQACAVACRGTDYLVVWQDGRDGHTLASEIRGRLFALDGTPQGDSFRISNRLADDISPSVAASGGKYLVAWCVNDAYAGNDDVMAAFVSGAASVSAPIPVATAPDRQENGVSVAGGANGGFFVAWRGGSLFTAPAPASDDVFGTWVSATGTVAVPNGFVVSSSAGKERAVAAAGGAETYGIVWREGTSHRSNVFGVVVPAAPPAVLPVLQRQSFTVNSNAHAPEIAWNGVEYRVVWRIASDNQGTSRIESAAMNESGVLSAGLALSPSTGYSQFEPVILSSGDGWQVLWMEPALRVNPPVPLFDECSVVFASLDATGKVINTDRFAPRFIDHDTLVAAAAPDGGFLFVSPTAPDGGKETARTGQLESVLCHPGRPPLAPGLSISTTGPLTTLRWSADPWFPRDAGVLETGTDLQQWKPLLQPSLVIPAQGTGNEAFVTFPTIPGARRYFRLNSSVPGPP